MSKTTTNRMKHRINMVLAVMILLGFGTLVVRLYFLQVVEGEFYQKKAIEQQMRSTTISAQRGTIYDRNMKTLAQSATVFTVFISPAEITTEESRTLIADGLSEILGVDREKVMEATKKTGSYYERIKSKVEKETVDKINAYLVEHSLKGVYPEPDTKRYYPYGSLASTVLGFTGSENKGAYGLESYYDKILSGTPGLVTSAKNAWGTDMNFTYQQMYDAQDGNSLVLTIDEKIQHFLEKNLETAVTEHQVGNRATGIVMNVKTGEILGMATKPDFDPNEPNKLGDPAAQARVDALKGNEEAYKAALQQAQYDQWRNKAISDPYEPGSVFKLITAAAALETHTVSANGSTFYCPGFYTVAGRDIGCWKNGGHGTITFAQAIKFSCNPAFMMTGQRLGAEEFLNYLDLFGFTSATGIDLPGESDAYLHPKATLMDPNMASLSSASFGQTFKVTPIQLITAVSASINGGKLLQPYVVKQVLDKDGNVISTTQTVVKRQVIAEDVSNELALLAEHVVADTDGSGRRAAVPGYRIGGKTGTSEKIDQKVNGEVTKHVMSFYGFAPADDPEIAILVILDEPALNNTYGSVIAAPVVGSIFSEVLPYLGYEPSYTAEELSKADVATPYLIGQNPHDAQSALTQQNLKCRIIGEGGKVVRQVPGAGEPIPKNGTVILYTDSTVEQTTVTVPDVVGLSGAQANRTILNAGLNIRVDGEKIENQGSVAISQNPPAGTQVDLGTVVTVTFATKNVEG